MSTVHPARRWLLELVRRRDEQIDLVQAAQAIAWEDQGSADLRLTAHRLEALVLRTRAQLAPGGTFVDQAEQIVEYLHEVEGFRGDPAVYDDPATSYLPDVLEQRIGLPITLALVLLHVGWQLGLPFEPAALPVHFMVRLPDAGGALFLDLFYGRVLDNEQCRAFLQNESGYEMPDPARFPPPSRRQVLARLLRNLKRCHFRREDFHRALLAAERIIVLEPTATDDLRDRGFLRARLGQLHLALLDLERYATLEPLASDHSVVRQRALAIAETLGRRN